MTSAHQYATLPWRRAGQLEIMLITSRETKRWVIPKGSTTEESLGFFEYQKRGKGQLRVDVFAMRVTEVLDQWPEAHERTRQWFPSETAAGLVDEPQLAALIRGFVGDQSERVSPIPTYLQAVWQRLKVLLHRVAAQ
jgi:hypothetical protein